MRCINLRLTYLLTYLLCYSFIAESMYEVYAMLVFIRK